MAIERRHTYDRRQFLTVFGKAAALGVLTSSVIGRIVEAEEIFDVPLGKDIEPSTFDVRFLMYHEVTPQRYKSDILSLFSQGYQPISLETFAGALNGEIKIPTGLKTFMPTMDDGRLSQYYAVMETTDEIKEETGWFVPVTLFTMSKFEDSVLPVDQIPGNTPSYNDGVHRYMTRDQLINLIRAGHQVQNHTVNHGVLSDLSVFARNAEIKDGDDRIQTLWDMADKERKIKAFAYPYGRYNEDIINLLQSLGYNVAFVTNPTTIHSSASPLEIGRISAT